MTYGIDPWYCTLWKSISARASDSFSLSTRGHVVKEKGEWFILIVSKRASCQGKGRVGLKPVEDREHLLTAKRAKSAYWQPRGLRRHVDSHEGLLTTKRVERTYWQPRGFVGSQEGQEVLLIAKRACWKRAKRSYWQRRGPRGPVDSQEHRESLLATRGLGGPMENKEGWEDLLLAKRAKRWLREGQEGLLLAREHRDMQGQETLRKRFSQWDIQRKILSSKQEICMSNIAGLLWVR